jgi:hypothetical protein
VALRDLDRVTFTDGALVFMGRTKERRLFLGVVHARRTDDDTGSGRGRSLASTLTELCKRAKASEAPPPTADVSIARLEARPPSPQSTTQPAFPDVTMEPASARSTRNPPLGFLATASTSARALLEEKGRLELQDALAIAVGVARALADLHASERLHLDVKPENVVMAAARSGTVAVRLEGAIDPAVVAGRKPGDVIGSPLYNAPELAREGTLTEAADVWALGVLVFELLTGETPFAQGRPKLQHLRARIASDEPPSLSDLRAEVPRSVARIVNACLEKDASRRPRAAEVGVVLKQGMLET